MRWPRRKSVACKDARVIERAPFGRTGHESSRIIFGAAAVARVDQDRADQVLPLLLEHGVNHIDTAAMYGDAELRIAPWLKAHPGEFFLATKTHARDGDGARASLEKSLERMGVDHVDLIQLHNLVEPDEWEAAHGRGGALEALRQAREEGLTRFIGVTGHGLRIAGMHLRSLERFDFDTVLLPYSYTLMQNGTYRGDVERLLALCHHRKVAVQTIKAIARRRWTAATRAPGEKRQSWYEPLTDPAAISRAIHFVLHEPQLFIDSSSALDQLPHVLAAAESPLPPNLAELAADLASAEMTPLFDGAELERI
jgi:aryl-alcohol dehydrogenase-like predicted oxidoreductase